MTIEQRREAIKAIIDMADEKYLKEIAGHMAKMPAPTVRVKGEEAKKFLSSVSALIKAAK